MASARGFGAELTGGKGEDQWDAELGVGYGFELGPVNVRPVAGAFIYQSDDDRYYTDRFSNGQDRCRDRRTGQFASDSRCDDVAALFYAKVDATASIGDVAEVRVGGRYMDEKVRPYGLVAVSITPKFKVVGSAGHEFFAGGIRFDF